MLSLVLFHLRIILFTSEHNIFSRFGAADQLWRERQLSLLSSLLLLMHPDCLAEEFTVFLLLNY